MNPEPVRIGIAGAGGFATNVMAPLIDQCPDLVLHAVAARDAARGAALNPAGSVHTSYEQLANDPEVDAIYVALSNDLHQPVTEMALQAGKHVLCEKPLAINAEQAAHMFAVAEQSDRVLVEGFWYLWHPRQRALIDLARGGEFGSINSIDSGFVFDGSLDGNFRLDPALGGGASYDVMCYAISFALSLLDNRAPESASIEDSVLTDQGVDVFARARLDWADGVFATTTGGFTGPERRWGSVVGANGGALVGEPCFSHAPEGVGGTSLTITEPDGSVRETLTFEPSNPRADMLSDFAGVVSGRIPAAALPVSPAHSLAVMTALDLVHEKLGRAH